MMRAFVETLKSKDEAVALAQYHYDHDNYRKGAYWEDGRGCSLGCMVHDYRDKTGTDWHAATEPLYGIPQSLSFLQDSIFEGLPIDKANEWTLRFFKAIPDGADLSMATSRLMYWLMTDPEMVLKHSNENGTKVINTVAELYKRRLDGDEPDQDEWEQAARSARSAAWSARSARSAAESAAWSAWSARSAAESAAWSARSARSARSAAWSARSAAESAAWSAWSAAESAAWSAWSARSARSARSAAYEKIADKLIEILEMSPIGENK